MRVIVLPLIYKGGKVSPPLNEALVKSLSRDTPEEWIGGAI